MAFRLLHLADLLLDVPFFGLGPLPRAMFERLRDAPVATLDRLVDAAVDHDVDAVLIAGGTSVGGSVGRSAGGGVTPRSAARLAAALERLAGAGIPTVIVLNGREGGLPTVAGYDLPDAVTVVEPGQIDAVVIEHHGEPAVTVIAASAPLTAEHGGRAARHVPDGDLVIMATIPPGGPPRLDPNVPAAFWALGGSPEPRAGRVGAGWGVVAAPPQPRVLPPPGPRPAAAVLESGPSGPRPPHPLDLADVSLARVAVDLAAASTPQQLEDLVAAGLEAVVDGSRPVMCELVAVGVGPLRSGLSDPATRQRLLARLRAQAAAERTPVWWIDVVTAPLPPVYRTQLAAHWPPAAVIEARATALVAAGPDPALVDARASAGVAGLEGLPAPGAWPALVGDATSVALDALTGARP